MNRSIANQVANAVLYEGYILYPYRPSVKNRQRWTFGGLYPEPYSRQTGGTDASMNRTECLIRGDSQTTIEVIVRFLHLTNRQVGEFDPALETRDSEGEIQYRPVDMLHDGERSWHTWQEAEEREVAIGPTALSAISKEAHPFAFTGRRWREPIRAADGSLRGTLDRQQHSIIVETEISVAPAGNGLRRLTVVVRNNTPLTLPASRDDALMRSLISTHILLGVRGGEFISLLDPPEEYRDAAAHCTNTGVWPVLVGEPGAADMMLSSPIILYDYPQVSPESPGEEKRPHDERISGEGDSRR